MELSAPTQMVFIISAVLAVLALLGALSVISALAPFAFWIMTAAFVVLALGAMLKGL